MAKPLFSPEWSKNGCDSPSPNGYDGCIPDRLGRGLRGKTGVRSLDKRVPLLAHKLSGAQSCFPGTDSFSPLSQGASCDCQDEQHGGSVSCKPQGGFTVVHTKQTWAPPPPLVSGQVPLLESGSCSRSFEPRSRFSVETEAQVRGMDVEPSNSSPNLGFVRRSGPLYITGVIPMPALVLPEFPGISGHTCACSPLAGQEAVRVSASQADSGSPVQGEGERCPSPTRSPVLAIPDVVLGADSSSTSAPLGDSDQAGPALSASGQYLAPSTRGLEAAFQNLGAAIQKARSPLHLSLDLRVNDRSWLDDRRDINLMSNIFKLEAVTSNDWYAPSSQVGYPTWSGVPGVSSK